MTVGPCGLEPTPPAVGGGEREIDGDVVRRAGVDGSCEKRK